MTVAELRKAFLLLSPGERELIAAIYIRNLTEREFAKQKGVYLVFLSLDKIFEFNSCIQLNIRGEFRRIKFNISKQRVRRKKASFRFI